jgi:LacI family transcriptional regulator
VSFVLNARADTGITEETRQRVLAAARDLGYHPHGAARALAGGASNTIGSAPRPTGAATGCCSSP